MKSKEILFASYLQIQKKATTAFKLLQYYSKITYNNVSTITGGRRVHGLCWPSVQLMSVSTSVHQEELKKLRMGSVWALVGCENPGQAWKVPEVRKGDG